MQIDVPISLGELLDKISILMIKEEKIKEQSKLNLVKVELDLLRKNLSMIIETYSDNKDKIFSHIENLKEVNSKLWNIEDQIRDCERKNIFDKKFIELARSVYFSNDKRSEIKKQINLEFGSKIVEVKSYEDY